MSTQNKPFTLSKFSLNRNTTQINLCMLLLILLAILGIVLTIHSFNSVAESQRILLEANEERAQAPTADVNAPGTDVSASAAGATAEAAQAVSTGRTRLLIVGAISVALLLFTTFVLIRIGIRSVALEVWIRRMGAGDLDYRVEPTGRDEITELTIALEELRKRSVKAMQVGPCHKTCR